jgi:hypothetical protein
MGILQSDIQPLPTRNSTTMGDSDFIIWMNDTV